MPRNVISCDEDTKSVLRDKESSKREDLASLLGNAANYQLERGPQKDTLRLCFLARNIPEEITDEMSVQKADVLNVIGAIYDESGAAHIHEVTELMLRVLQFRMNRLNSRKKSDPEYEEDFICVSNALSNLSCCGIGLRKRYKVNDAMQGSDSVTLCKSWKEFNERFGGHGVRFFLLSPSIICRSMNVC